jgi:hypothetical protein
VNHAEGLAARVFFNSLLKAMLDAFPPSVHPHEHPRTALDPRRLPNLRRQSTTRGWPPQATLHDPRGTAIARLSEAGATPQEIATIAGHSLRTVHEILDKYLDRRRTLAEAAMLELENATRTTFANRLQTARIAPERKTT